MAISSRIRVAFAIMTAVLLSARPVYAEDIEIYLVSGEESGGANVLVLIDNSGGTNRRFPGTAYSEGGKTIDEIAYALDLVLGGLAGATRLGVASQLAGGDNGGAINYPVKQIDEKSAPIGTARVTSPQGDAYQYMVVPSVPLAVDDVAVLWKPFPNLTDDPDADADNMLLPMPSILSTGGTENVIGFQLTGLNVPRYAKISNATLTMRSPSPNKGATSSFGVRMAYEKTASPVAFSDMADFPSRSTWSVPFDAGGGSFNAKGGLSGGVVTIDVTDVIQDAVSYSTWCGGQTLSMMIQGTDIPISDVPQIYSFRAEDADGTRLGVTELNVEWDTSGSVGPADPVTDDQFSCMGNVVIGLGADADDGTETTDGRNLQLSNNVMEIKEVTGGAKSLRGVYIAGARFQGVGFPAGTRVGKAQLTGRILSATGSPATLEIRPMLGDTPAFAASGDISGRALGTESATVPATVGNFSVDIKDLVQEIFDSAGWTDGGAIGLRFDRAAGSLIGLHDLNNGAASALVLTLDVLAPQPGNFATSFSRREDMANAIAAFSNATGGGKNKPASAYAEAAAYMLGESAIYGQSFSHEEAFVGSIRTNPYLSPTAAYDECGGNHIILVTHAESSGESFKPAIDALTGNTECPGDGNTDAWACSAVLAKYLADGANNSLGINIQTHTIAFAPQKEETVAGLRAVADAGNGEYRKSENALELAKVLSDVINKLTTTDASMAAPGVAVNQLNRFRHLDQLYYALFRPSFDSRWQGNLKRYRLDFGTQRIVDENDNPAVDLTTGFFKEDSNSWWGEFDGIDLSDGQNVAMGGARQELLDGRLTPRRLLIAQSSPAAGGSDTALSAPAGIAPKLVQTLADVTAAQMGSADTLAADELQLRLDFLLTGWGDPLHTEPRLINYGFTGTFEEAMQDDTKQDNTVFVSTNDGMLHAIEPKTGEELFAFMPGEEALKTEARYLSSLEDSADAPPELDPADPQRATYGLDGGITVWRRAKNDGSGEPEHVFLYLSQRRGGNAYYALNVTDRSSPKLMWKIQGGVAPFSKLGQTWSQPTLAQIVLNGERVPVLIFGGGYSPTDHDATGAVSGGDTVGNAIYIVNAFNGEHIWSVSNTGETVSHADMKWAISSAPSVVDINFDGVIDYIYTADLGGQVFRVDMNAENSGEGNLAKRVVTLAKLGTSDAGGISNHRRFHAAPVVALSKRETGEEFLQVALGSGYRSHPLNMDTQDFIFMIDDTDALQDTSSTPVTRADMVDVTTNLSPDPSLFDGKRGWFIQLENGEKVLSSGVVSNGTLFMSSYLPESAFVNKCQRVVGSSRLYAMGLLDGAPAVDLDNDGNVDRSTDLVLPGLPPSPQLLLDGTGEQVLLIGTAALSGGKVGGGKGVRKTRWFEVQTQAEADEELEDAMLGQ